ncbi:MAG: peptidoglycan bridge formation glycyltransferase FemA/FemB family protein [Patescibacteria group bacterium]
MEINFIDKNKKEEWNEFLIKNKGSFLQSFEWGELQKKVERLEISKAGKKLLQAQIIKEKVPFFSYFYIPYGPVYNQDISLEEKRESFIALTENIAKKEKAVFLRLEPSVFLPETDIFNSKTALRRIQPKKTLILNLEKPEEEILESIHKKTKYNIKLAERKGVKIRVLDDYSNIFFNLLKKTKERQNFISYSEEHYKELFKIKSKDFKVKMFLVEYQNKVIVASIVVFFGDRVTSLHTGSGHEYRALKGPDLLRWEVIAYGKKLGYKVYDFWGIDDEKFPGVSNFKRGFGGQEIEYPLGVDIIFNNAQYQIYKAMRKIKHGF